MKILTDSKAMAEIKKIRQELSKKMKDMTPEERLVCIKGHRRIQEKARSQSAPKK